MTRAQRVLNPGGPLSITAPLPLNPGIPEDMSHPYATSAHIEPPVPVPAFPRDTHQLPILEPHHLGGWRAVCVTLQRQRLPRQSRHVGHTPLFPDAGGHLGSKEKQKRGSHVAQACQLGQATHVPLHPQVLRPVISLSPRPRETHLLSSTLVPHLTTRALPVSRGHSSFAPGPAQPLPHCEQILTPSLRGGIPGHV